MNSHPIKRIAMNRRRIWIRFHKNGITCSVQVPAGNFLNGRLPRCMQGADWKEPEKPGLFG